MKVKKIISGIIIIGMTFGLTGISFAGEKNNRRNNDRQIVKVNKHQNRQVAKVDNRQDRQSDRFYHGKKSRDRYQSRNNRHNNQRMKHGDRYYSRNDRYKNRNNNTNRSNSIKLRTVVTPFGIFPVIW